MQQGEHLVNNVQFGVVERRLETRLSSVFGRDFGHLPRGAINGFVQGGTSHTQARLPAFRPLSTCCCERFPLEFKRTTFKHTDF